MFYVSYLDCLPLKVKTYICISPPPAGGALAGVPGVRPGPAPTAAGASRRARTSSRT